MLGLTKRATGFLNFGGSGGGSGGVDITSFIDDGTPIAEINGTILFSPPIEFSENEKIIGKWFGFDLYCKIIDFGLLPNATSKEVTFIIEDLKDIVNAVPIANSVTDGAFRPVWTFVDHVYSNLTDFIVTKEFIRIAVRENYSSYTMKVILLYTKGD